MECKRTNECERYKRISWHFEGKLRLVFNSYKGALTSFNFTATERIRKLNNNHSNNRMHKLLINTGRQYELQNVCSSQF